MIQLKQNVISNNKAKNIATIIGDNKVAPTIHLMYVFFDFISEDFDYLCFCFYAGPFFFGWRYHIFTDQQMKVVRFTGQGESCVSSFLHEF
jgi:hypothetical protein